MRTRQFLFFILTFAIISSSTVSAEEQERDVAPFSAVSLRISGTVFLKQGNQQSVRVVASESTLEELITEVKEGALVIRLRNNNYFWNSFNTGKIEIYVTARDIEALTVSGSGNIESKNIDTRNLELTVSGSGDISIEKLDAERVTARVSGSGNIVLHGGVASEFEANISGSGKIRADDFEAENVDTTISGSGNMTVSAQNALKARVTGSGSVSYKGSPQVDTSVTGSGRIKRL